MTIPPDYHAGIHHILGRKSFRPRPRNLASVIAFISLRWLAVSHVSRYTLRKEMLAIREDNDPDHVGEWSKLSSERYAESGVKGLFNA